MADSSETAETSLIAPSMSVSDPTTTTKPRIQAPEVKALYANLPLQQEQEQIRVITVDAGVKDNPITATLKVVDLKAMQSQYTALSYVWGEFAEPVNTIYCNGANVEVTINCHTALLNLRQSFGSFTIWVDAICIDQANGDSDEKRLQMALMPKIYGEASSVYVWLGAGSQPCRRAMDYFETGDLDPSSSIATALRLLCPTSSLYPASRVNTLKANTSDITELLGSRWLKRMWTYQEMLFAQNPIIVYGQRQIKWHRFEDKLLLLSSLHASNLRQLLAAWLGLSYGRELMGSAKEPWKFTERREFMQTILKQRAQFAISFWALALIGTITGIAFLAEILTKSRMTLQDQSMSASSPSHINVLGGVGIAILIIASMFSFFSLLDQLKRPLELRHSTTSADDIVLNLARREAGRPIDMAYGAWNVLKKLGAKELPQQLEGDNVDLHNPYWRMSIALLQTTDGLQLLTIAAATPRLGLDTPSWVPDWSMQMQAPDLEQGRGITHILGSIVSSDDKVHAPQSGKKAEASQGLSIDRKILTVTARELGVLRDCKSFVQAEAPNADLQIFNLQLALSLDKFLLCSSKSWSSLLAGKVEGDLAAWHCELSRLRRRIAASSTKRHTFAHADTGWSESLLAMHIKVCNQLAGHKLSLCFVVWKGRTHRKTQALCQRGRDGDCVLRVQGNLRPLVMRRADPEHNDVTVVSWLVLREATVPRYGRSREPLGSFDIS